jgi:hypothetical protein
MPYPLTEALIIRSDCHRKNSQYWQLLDALSEGGHKVTLDIKADLLANPTARPREVIEKRVKVAPFEPIMGGVISKLVSQVLRDEGSYTGSKDPWWQDEFFPRAYLCDGEKLSFQALLVDCFLQWLTQGEAIVQVDTMGESNEPYLLLRKRWELWDSSCELDGARFCKLHAYYEKRDSWDGVPDRYHEFLIYQMQDGMVTASKYQIRRLTPKDEVFSVHELETSNPEHLLVTNVMVGADIFHLSNGRYKFPLIKSPIPPQLWIADQLFDLQKAHYNSGAGGRFAMAATNYAQLIFTGAEGVGQDFGSNVPATYSPSGDGYYWALPIGMTASWLERDTAGIAIAFDVEEKTKASMLEKIHSISQYAAASYSSRLSGVAKQADKYNLDVLLEIYGQKIRELAKQILDVAAIARGEDVDWQVEGFSGYSFGGLTESINEYLLLESANIPSETLGKEAQKGIAIKANQKLGLSDKKLDTILTEIEEAPAYHLDEKELAIIERLASAGILSPEMTVETLYNAGILQTDNDDNANESEPGDDPESETESDGETNDAIAD